MANQSKKPYYGKKKTGNKNYKSSPKQSERHESSEDDRWNHAGGNDPQWYAADPQLLRDIASFPYSYAVGTKIDNGIGSQWIPSNVDKYSFIPGICGFKMYPSIGRTLDGSDPVNIAAYSIFANIRKGNSGRANYNAPDLMLYLTTMSQLYSWINWAQRLYGLTRVYNQRNRYIPRAFLELEGVDIDNFSTSLAQLRYGINVIINKVAAFAVPGTMTFFNRQSFLYTGIYSEGPDIKDQQYYMYPAGFFKYGYDADKAGQLALEAVPATLTVESLLEYGNSLIAPIINEEDFNIMSGDILKVYQSNIIAMTSLPEDYMVLPVFNLEMLEQFHNAVPVGTVHSEDLVIKQDPTKGFLVHQPLIRAVKDDTEEGFYTRVGLLNRNLKLTTASPNPTPEISIENTRLMAVGIDATYFKTIEGDLYACQDFVCGSEFVESITYVTTKLDALGQVHFEEVETDFIEMYYVQDYSVTTLNKSQEIIDKLTIRSAFKFGPRMLTGYATDRTGSSLPIWNHIQESFEVDNYTVLTPSVLEQMHECALLNELHVAPIGRV